MFSRNNGYSLGYIGKWRLDSPREPHIDGANNKGDTKWNEWCPPHGHHGFDFWYSCGTYEYHDRPMYWRGDAGPEDFHFVHPWGPEHEADLPIKYPRNEDGSYRDESRPFGLVVAMNPPHTPDGRGELAFAEKGRASYDSGTDANVCSLRACSFVVSNACPRLV